AGSRLSCWTRSILSGCTARIWSGRPPRLRPPRSSPARRSTALSRPREKVAPDRLVAQRGDEGPVSLAVGIGNPRDKRHRALPPWRLARRADPDLARIGRQNELRLPRADEIDIDLGQQLGIQQRAVLGAAGIVDRITRAEIVEPVGDAGMFAACQ